MVINNGNYHCYGNSLDRPDNRCMMKRISAITLASIVAVAAIAGMESTAVQAQAHLVSPVVFHHFHHFVVHHHFHHFVVHHFVSGHSH
jgi:hypothetical protein